MEDKNVKSKIAEREEEILKFWQENKIFEKSLEKPSPKGNFVFFDGPPFATGLPHYGHILPGTIKDVIPRYQTMQGKKVLRRWGWDCHGLPIENLVEKELGLSSKKDIEDYGVGKFNKVAKETVMRYADEWRRIIPRVGRWVDMENDYKTMDTPYTESVWWAFKNLYDKGLIYKSFKSMHLCPHCETTLSNFEVNQGYKDIVDISVYLKFKIEGEENTFFLAWTTTPWTLPGNVALAINKDVDYVKVKKDDQFFILAKDLVDKVLKENYEIVKEFKGEELLGKSYVPLFPYYNNEKLENRKNGFKVYHGDFVTTTDGTGIVHIAPAFGEDDMNLGKSENLPFIQHVNIDGTFKSEVTDFAGQKVKPKDDPSNHQDQSHQKADVEVLKYLAKAGTLFEKEKYTHSYPHCWRCDTPLLNYATTSWFVNVTNIKDRMSELNSKICWMPKEIGEGRFGKWIEGARDWAISRSRYWGAPFPVWEDEEGSLTVLGSIDELKNHIKKSGNKYFLMRHGEAEQNLKDLVNSKVENVFHLTKEGDKQASAAAKALADEEKIDLIICSPFERCLETAKIVAENLGVSKENILVDEKISEFKAGDEFEGKTWAEYYKFFECFEERFEKAPNGGETIIDLNKRVGGFLYDIDSKYQNKNILVVTHEGVITALQTIALGVDKKGAMKVKLDGGYKSKFAEIREIDFVPLPHNEDYELDLHKPYIDDVKLISKNGIELKRVSEVFDCWFESGSMSFAQNHYPFENKEEMEKTGSSLFPADFIAEGLDQTRGWFYTMLILGTGLFEKSPYDSVIVNGLVLAEDGRKMSKSLKNYPDLMYIVDKYGADNLRFYLMSSPAVKAEDLNFSEKGVDEISKKLVMKLGNILSFYEMYKDEKIKPNTESKNVLDKWILLKLTELALNITKSLDAYKIDSASRPIIDFIEDFSTWYIRRSRDRFKSDDLEDKKDALATTHFVLINLAKVIAPFVPFFAEDIYLKLKSEGDSESVHLCDWFIPSVVGGPEDDVIKNMEEVRKVVSLALEKRMAAGIKVRQPLNELKIKSKKLEGKEEYFDLIKDEVNVKNVSFSDELEEEVWLDTEITEDLKREGNIRDIIRAIQELRKQNKLMPQDEIELIVDTDEKGKEFMDSNFEEIKKPTNVSKIKFEKNSGEELKIDSVVFKIQIG